MARHATLFPTAVVMLAFGCVAPPLETIVQANEDTLSPPGKVAADTVTDHQTGAWRTIPNDKSTVVFENGDTLRTGLQDLKMVTEFYAAQRRQWYVLSGHGDASDKNEISLYVLSPSDSLSGQAIQQPWHMPGRLIDDTDGESFYEAEVFAGEVLPDTIGVIWYDRSLMPDGTWRLNTTLLNLSKPLPDTLILFSHERKSATINLAFRGKCQLLDSLDQRIEP